MFRLGQTMCPSCATGLPWWSGWLHGPFLCPGCAAASLAVFLTAPMALALIVVNAWLFPLELELLALPPDPVEAADEVSLDDSSARALELTDKIETPAPWAPRLQTIEPPVTFAGIAITVLIAAVSAYHVWVAIDALVTRFTVPASQTLATGNLPIQTDFSEDALNVTNHSDVIWSCVLIVPGAGITVTKTIDIPPRQTQAVTYGSFVTSDSILTPRQVRAFARERLSATCEDRRGTVRVGNLR